VTISVAHLEFDHVTYDADADVLYLAIGEPREAADQVVTQDGHLLRYDGRGELIGITLVNAKWLAERDGVINASFPIPAEKLVPAFA
jgi:uncharacterized protein YuzE